MTDAAFARIIPSCYIHSLPIGATLVSTGDIPDSAFILLKGAVDAVAQHGSRSTLLSIREAPDQLCFATAIHDLPALSTFTICQPSRVAFLPAAALRHAIAQDQPFAQAIFELTAQLLRAYVMELKNQKLRTGPERLAAWLLRQNTDKQPAFTLPYDKRRIAARLGMTPENLSRSFAVLVGHGVTLNSARVTIAAPELLADFAGQHPTIDDFRL